jgi:hypothetical protein
VDLLRSPQPRDEVGQFGTGTITGATPTITKWGGGYSFEAGDTQDEISYVVDDRIRNLFQSDHSITVVIRGRQGEEAQGGAIFSIGDGLLWFSFQQDDPGNITTAWDDNALKREIVVSTNQNDKLIVISAVRRNGIYYNYQAGVEEGTVSVNNNFTAAADEWVYGNRLGTEWWTGDMMAVYIHERGLTLAEHKLLATDPYGIVRPVLRITDRFTPPISTFEELIGGANRAGLAPVPTLVWQPIPDGNIVGLDRQAAAFMYDGIPAATLLDQSLRSGLAPVPMLVYFPEPDGTVSALDRQQATWLYSGIAAAAPAAVVGPLPGSLVMLGVGR